MFIVKFRKIFYGISALLFIISIGAMCVWGLNFGIDFKGGTSVGFQYANERYCGVLFDYNAKRNSFS